ncbi:MAG: exodeoxyribonuclease VII large subunit [Clostridia bacterium]|nr:exodeoxyribonuclease VII large subunit [Clostridia bacterium]
MPSLKLSVTQLNNYIKNIFDNEELLYNIGVFGEVTNYKISGGNAYFDIKDDGATLSCLEFGAKTDIRNGDSVLVSGRPNYHVKLGRFSFIASKIEPYGQGELYLKFLALKKKLEDQGIFDERNKKQIPKYAKNIGVVTSETGAVIHDIINVTRSKNPFTNIILYPTKVQGEGASEEIVRGIKYFNTQENIDVIIVARGGGSMEDLSPYNTEEVALAVFESEKPIVSGVGHETDFSLCDFASDLRTPTPSVAADVCVFDYYSEIEQISGAMDAISYKINLIQTDAKNKAINISKDIYNSMERNLSSFKNLLKLRADNIYNQIKDKQIKEQKKLLALSSALEKMNPLSILKSGYSKTYFNGDVLTDTKKVKIGDKIDTFLPSGKLTSEIINIGE